MEATRPPRLFVLAATRRGLWSLAALTLLSGARSREILAGWGSAGETAMWWQLALDTPFLIGYGLFLAGACAAVARRASDAGRPRLERATVALAWLGPIAAVADLLQNLSLALILAGDVNQPWPRISAVAAPTTTWLCIVAALFALAGFAVTQPRTAELGG